jgi:hypothetical protein
MAGGTGEGSVDWGSWSPGCVPSEPGVANGNGVTSARLVPIAAFWRLNDVKLNKILAKFKGQFHDPFWSLSLCNEIFNSR